MSGNVASKANHGDTARLIIRPPRMTGRSFLLRLARILVFASLAQIVVSLLIRLTDITSLQILLYLFVAYLLCLWFFDRVQIGEIILMEKEVRIVQVSVSGKKSEISIPFEEISAVRDHVMGEDLSVTYHPVIILRRSLRPPLQIRLTWLISYVSTRLARRLAGTEFFKNNGILIVQRDKTQKKAYLFLSDEVFLSKLSEVLPEQFGKDDRLEDEPVVSMRSRMLQHAFPELYPHVLPLICEDEISYTGEKTSKKQRKKRKSKRKPISIK